MKRYHPTFFKILYAIYFTIFLSCSGGEKLNKDIAVNISSDQIIVYIINSSIHTGIIIPVDSESISRISALKYFKDFQFADFGWGEEFVYQHPDENYCFYAKAVLLPNSSVISVEGYSSVSGMINWSDFTVKLTLSTDQFMKLMDFIDKSFKRENNEPIITSKKHSGDVIFFKSVYRYHMFNTCNTWVAKALEIAGLDVSPFFVLTSGQLYKEIKDNGTVLKTLK